MMETEYGVGITNRYAFLVDDVEDLEMLDKKKEDKVVAKGPKQPGGKSALKKKPGVVASAAKDKKAKTTKSTSSIETSKGEILIAINISW